MEPVLAHSTLPRQLNSCILTSFFCRKKQKVTVYRFPSAKFKPLEWDLQTEIEKQQLLDLSSSLGEELIHSLDSLLLPPPIDGEVACV